MFFALFNKTSIIQDILAYIDHINNLDPSDHQSLFTILFNLSIGLIKQMKLIAMTLYIVIAIIVYFDDFEPNNAIGSRSGSHKIGGVYIKIACLPDHLNYKLAHIYAASSSLLKIENISILETLVF